MEFLRLLEGLRTPILDTFFGTITYLGDETVFMALAIVLFWCVNKRYGYYCFFVGFAGTISSQFLKLWYRIPRPWVVDPGFTIVESARVGAGGYSFPSGHTQSVVGTLGVVAIAAKQKWLKILCAIFVILVPFSRMYLGVHTPLDVGVGFGLAVLLMALLWPFCKSDERLKKSVWWLFLVMCLLCAVYMVYVTRSSFPADVDADNLSHSIKNSYTLLGCSLGLMITYWFDSTKLHFSTQAPLAGQILKLALGFLLVLGVRIGLKPILATVFGDVMFNNTIRYFFMFIVGGCIWPMTFPFWAKVGAKK